MSTDLKSNHRPLRAGIGITTSAGEPSRGTLTAVARRDSDGARVGVTNLHILSYGNTTDYFGVTGSESLYQGGTGEGDKIGSLYPNSWVPVQGATIPPNYAHLDIVHSTPNPCDVAAVLIPSTVSTYLGVHDHDPVTGEHVKRPIVRGTVEPIRDMRLDLYGSTTGISRGIRVTLPGQERTIKKDLNDDGRSDKAYTFDNVVLLARGLAQGMGGDSGSPCLYEDEDGNYRMCAISFGGKDVDKDGGSETGYAFPASVAETRLGIYFGVQAPIANAGVGGTVVAGEHFSLDGRGSAAVEPGATITEYRWEQTHTTAIPSRGTDTAQPTFSAPPRSTTLTFKLTVTDSNGAKASVTVTVTVVSIPPIPTGDQWEVRQQGNKIQVKVTEIPTVIPAISQVKAKLGISPLGTGLGSDTITVTKDIGTALNQWVDVLTDADSKWQAGTWTAQVRFENTEGNSEYSPGKPVTVLPPNNPPVANAGYNQVARANTRATLSGAASDPDASDQDDLSYRWRKRSGAFVQMSGVNTRELTFTAPRFDTTLKFRLTVTDPHGAKNTDHVTVWVYDDLISPHPNYNRL